MKTLLVSALILLAFQANAALKVFESSDRHVSLVELYTSEGCSSCPPAEQKLNSYADSSKLWNDFVPVAFHVDYWNYLGWDDRFSKPEFTTRQRQYSKDWKARTIYTPCFVINGKATRHPVTKAGKEHPGSLKAELDGAKLSITFNATQKHKQLQLWAAPLSGKESTKVKYGENRGRTLEHYFVVLDLNQTKMTEADGKWSASLELDGSLPASALAVWVSNGRNLAPIQATGGWLK